MKLWLTLVLSILLFITTGCISDQKKDIYKCEKDIDCGLDYSGHCVYKPTNDNNTDCQCIDNHCTQIIKSNI